MLLLENLVPTFLGHEWAGARLWKASMRGVEHSHCNHLSTMLQNNNNNTALLELGSGLDTPEKIARFLGA